MISQSRKTFEEWCGINRPHYGAYRLRLAELDNYCDPYVQLDYMLWCAAQSPLLEIIKAQHEALLSVKRGHGPAGEIDSAIEQSKPYVGGEDE